MALKSFAPAFASIPSEQFLVQGALIDLSSATTQNLTQLTSPPNVSAQDPKLKFVITKLVVRPLQTNAATATTLGFGWAATAATSSVTVAAQTALPSAQAANTGFEIVPGAGGFANPQPLGQPQQYLNVTVAVPQAAGFFAQVDVVGYYPIA